VIFLDGTEEAERSVPYGFDLARWLGVPLHLVRVVGDGERWARSPRDGTAPSSAYIDEMADMAAEYLDHVRAWLVGRGVVATTEVRHGDTQRQILAVAGERDLLILAAHDGGAPAADLRAIVSEVLAQRVRCSIFVVPPGDR
jgi:nucleotide-binding universal stress UspA family protein